MNIEHWEDHNGLPATWLPATTDFITTITLSCSLKDILKEAQRKQAANRAGGGGDRDGPTSSSTPSPSAAAELALVPLPNRAASRAETQAAASLAAAVIFCGACGQSSKDSTAANDTWLLDSRVFDSSKMEMRLYIYIYSIYIYIFKYGLFLQPFLNLLTIFTVGNQHSTLYYYIQKHLLLYVYVYICDIMCVTDTETVGTQVSKVTIPPPGSRTLNSSRIGWAQQLGLGASCASRARSVLILLWPWKSARQSWQQTRSTSLSSSGPGRQFPKSWRQTKSAHYQCLFHHFKLANKPGMVIKSTPRELSSQMGTFTWPPARQVQVLAFNRGVWNLLPLELRMLSTSSHVMEFQTTSNIEPNASRSFMKLDASRIASLWHHQHSCQLCKETHASNTLPNSTKSCDQSKCRKSWKRLENWKNLLGSLTPRWAIGLKLMLLTMHCLIKKWWTEQHQ